MADLKRVIYYSKADSSIKHQDIEKIFQSSKSNNQDQHVNGMLIYHNDWFLQAIEGPADNVKAIYDKIKQDNRHHHLVELENQKIEKPAFQSWDMDELDDQQHLDPTQLDANQCLALLKKASESKH